IKSGLSTAFACFGGISTAASHLGARKRNGNCIAIWLSSLAALHDAAVARAFDSYVGLLHRQAQRSGMERRSAHGLEAAGPPPKAISAFTSPGLRGRGSHRGGGVLRFRGRARLAALGPKDEVAEADAQGGGQYVHPHARRPPRIVGAGNVCE